MVPPFRVNPDGFRCLQCTLHMALHHLVGAEAPDLDALDRATHRRPGEGTWTHAAYLALARFPALHAVAYDAFDYRAFAARPLPTLLNTFPPSVAVGMAQGFDLVAAAALARRLLDECPVDLVPQPPTLRDVHRHLDEGWLLIANLNAAALDREPGITGHSVLVYDRDGSDLIAHDPGVDGHGTPSRRIAPAVFERAWSFMGDKNRELLAIRRRP